MRLLAQEGYVCVRGAGSLGPWDIVGLGQDGYLLVQVRTSRRPSIRELQSLQEGRAPAYCRRVVHVWHDRRPSQDVIWGVE